MRRYDALLSLPAEPTADPAGAAEAPNARAVELGDQRLFAMCAAYRPTPGFRFHGGCGRAHRWCERRKQSCCHSRTLASAYSLA